MAYHIVSNKHKGIFKMNDELEFMEFDDFESYIEKLIEEKEDELDEIYYSYGK